VEARVRIGDNPWVLEEEREAGPLSGSYWVESGRLLAGPYPDGPGDVEALLGVGVDLFVDLTREDEEWMRYWRELPEDQHRRFALLDGAAPSEEAMDYLLRLVSEQLTQGRIIYLHCKGGRGRTGTVVGCYLVEHGRTGGEALATIRRRCGHPYSPETDEQKDMVRGWRPRLGR
jgi:protein-tyrosine phosphatase